jgi:phage shock protein C
MRRRNPVGDALFYRDPANGMIAGVCAGLADQFGFRLAALRIVVAIAAILFTVPVLLGYVAAGLLLPAKPLTYYGNGDEREIWRRSRPGRADA